MVGSSCVRTKSVRSSINPSLVGLILCDTTLSPTVWSRSSTYRSSSLSEFGKTAEKVCCRSPTAFVSSACSFMSSAILATTVEESRPPDRAVPIGTSLISLCEMLLVRALSNFSTNSGPSDWIGCCNKFSGVTVEYRLMDGSLPDGISIYSPGISRSIPAKNVCGESSCSLYCRYL